MINKVSDNGGEVDPTVYQQEDYVHQLGRAPVTSSTTAPVQTGQTIPILRSYHFHGVFPTQVAPIELSYDQNNVVEEFAVEMQVQWWEGPECEWSGCRKMINKPIDNALIKWIW